MLVTGTKCKQFAHFRVLIVTIVTFINACCSKTQSSLTIWYLITQVVLELLAVKCRYL